MIVDSLAPVSIRPKEINVYEKFTQTDTTMETMGGGEEEEMEEETSVVAEVKEPELKQEERQVEGEGKGWGLGSFARGSQGEDYLAPISSAVGSLAWQGPFCCCGCATFVLLCNSGE